MPKKEYLFDGVKRNNVLFHSSLGLLTVVEVNDHHPQNLNIGVKYQKSIIFFDFNGVQNSKTERELFWSEDEYKELNPKTEEKPEEEKPQSEQIKDEDN